MDELGTPEHFFAETAKFIRANARGEVRCMVLIDTADNQFWIHGMVDSRVWEKGMLKAATDISEAKTIFEVTHQARVEDKVIADQRLRAVDIKGKPS